jgi:hypothetical protein
MKYSHKCMLYSHQVFYNAQLDLLLRLDHKVTCQTLGPLMSSPLRSFSTKGVVFISLAHGHQCRSTPSRRVEDLVEESLRPQGSDVPLVYLIHSHG